MAKTDSKVQLPSTLFALFFPMTRKQKVLLIIAH